MHKINLCRPILILFLGVVVFLGAQDPDSSWMQDVEDDFDSLNVSFLSNWPFADSK